MEVDSKQVPLTGIPRTKKGLATCPSTRRYCMSRKGKPRAGSPKCGERKLLWKPDTGSPCLKGTSLKLC